MKTSRLFTLFSVAVTLCLFSCQKETAQPDQEEAPEYDGKVMLTLSATGEQTDAKAFLDFSEAANVRWSDSDLIAVFDGTAKNQFSIKAGTNTGASASFEGSVTPGYTNLYTVYPYSAASSLNGSNLSVTVPSAQTVSSSAKVDPAALVSVGQVSAGAVEFKQVCGLLKFVIEDPLEENAITVEKVVLRGTNLAGTATVAAATGVLSSVTSGQSSIEITYDGGNFAAGTYFAAVLPGTTATGNFTVEFVEPSGLTHVRTAGKAVTVARKQGGAIGACNGADDSYNLVRHIANKAQLYTWGEAMGSEHGVTVYLDADINCASDPWTYSGASFDGTFEGQNHKIYNLIVTSDADNTGFISRLTGTLRNVTIGSSNGSSWDNVSTITHNGSSSSDSDTRYLGLVGRAAGSATMEGVNNYAKIIAAATYSRVYIGGLVGLIPESESATLTNCKNYGSITNNSTWDGGQTRFGGILGQCSGTIIATGVENHGTLTVNNAKTCFVGGLCGDLGSGSSVSGSKNYGTISFTDSGTSTTYVGGCFGSVRGSTVSDCHNYAAIIATRNAQHWFGGIAGFFESGESSLTSCTNHTGANLDVASSVATRVLMGGITGGCQYNGSGPFGVTLQSCKNEAAITNNGTASDFGGIAGLFDNYYASATILVQNCENTGAISSEVADNGTSMNRELRVGGIIGGTDPESAGCDQVFRSCINRGTVTIKGALKSGASVRFGGIVGNTYANVKIDKCKNFGDVGCPNTGGDAGSAVFYFGGIVGAFQSRTSTRYQSVTDCVNTGTISTIRNYSNQYLGGIVGGGTNADTYPVVSGCKNFGDVSATRTTNTLVGGLCGYTRWNMSNCSNFGDVTGGSHNGAVVGDANGNAIMNTGIKVGVDVDVIGAANQGTKYSNGKTTYTFGTASSAEKRWFTGDGTGAAVTVTVVDQETYSE